MKTKPILAVLLLIIASLSCETPPSEVMTGPTLTNPQAESTRLATIDQQQETFFTPDTWNLAPASCGNSMTMIITEEGYSSSGTIIQEEKWVDPQRNSLWVYHLLVSNHAIAESITATYTLLPGKSTSLYQDYKTYYLNYHPIMSTSGQIGVDAGILSVFGMAKIDREGFLPIGAGNLITGENQPMGETYYAFSYPGTTITAQFSTSTIVDIYEFEPYTIKFLPEGTTTSPGSSGGAICNSSGNIIAVVTRHAGNQPTEFTADPLPQNIAAQVHAAIQTSHNILTTNNITKAP